MLPIRTGRRHLAATLGLSASLVFCSCRHVPAVPAPGSRVDWDDHVSVVLSRYEVRNLRPQQVYGIFDNAFRTGALSGLPFGGVNAVRTGDAVHVYLIDQDAAASDSGVCGTAAPLRSRIELETCRRISVIEDNCAVVAPRTVACDVGLVWRVVRDAAFLTLASYKNPATGQHYFPLESLRRQFLAGEPRYNNNARRIANMEDVDALFAKPLVADVRPTWLRVMDGFLTFLLLHEIGHVRNHDVSGEALPACSLPATTRERLCQRPDARETRADEFAIRNLMAGIMADQLSPARTVPELFSEEFERRQYLALIDVGLDPLAWDPAKAGPHALEQYRNAWLNRMGTGSHPGDLIRYVALLDALQQSGVLLTESVRRRELARDAITTIDRFCTEQAAR